MAADDPSHNQEFKRGSSTAIREVLQRVQNESQKRVQNGFNQINFTLGVLNTLLIVFIFGAFPQHFWILYIIEAIVLISIKYHQLQNINHKPPLNGSLYILDYCWMMNFIGVFALLLLAFLPSHGSFSLHKQLFLVAMGVACGPLLGAAGILPFVALIFHDFGTMCDVFIHIYPPMLMYTLRWKADEILKSWPQVFDLDYDVEFFGGPGTIFGNTIILYLLWLIPYVYWMVRVGMDLPNKTPPSGQKPYDTVFHSNMRKGLCVATGTYIWKRPMEESLRQVKTNQFERRDLYIYLSGHFILVFLALCFLAYPCYKAEHLHGVLLCALALVVVWRGAMRYSYYSTELYVKIVREMASTEASSNGAVDENTPLL